MKILTILVTIRKLLHPQHQATVLRKGILNTLMLGAILSSHLMEPMWVNHRFRKGDSYHQNIQANSPVKFKNLGALMKQLKQIFKTSEHIFFNGSYDLPADPLISDKEHVSMTAHDIWKVSGYRFR